MRMIFTRLNSGIFAMLFALFAGVMVSSCKGESEDVAEAPKEKVMKYGLPIEDYRIEYDTLRPNETLTGLLSRFGFTINDVYKLTQCPDSVFNERKLRPGQVCSLLSDTDSIATPRFLVYEENIRDYVVFDVNNNFKAERKSNPSEWIEREVAGIVNSSLWVSMEENGASPLLAVEMSNIFGWSVDFFGVQNGDEYRLIYTGEYVGDTPMNNYRILAASFNTGGSTVYAIPFVQDNEELFYNVDGNSLARDVGGGELIYTCGKNNVGDREECTLEACRQTEGENSFQNSGVNADFRQLKGIGNILSLEEYDKHHSGRNILRNNGCKSNTVNAHFANNYEEKIEQNVDKTCRGEYEQRCL